MSAWGNLPVSPPEQRLAAVSRHAGLPGDRHRLSTSCLAVGNRRSYGDVCQNAGGSEIDTRLLDRFIAFNPATGVLRAEAGVLLADIITLSLPAGWFLPVTPGTRFVTLGGAVANDVHGKNHHRAGSFGRHVRGFELLRSDGQRLCCAPAENADLFAATIGGLGLTGMISWVEIQLARVPGPWLQQTQTRFASLDEFVALNRKAEVANEHVVAWIDCLAKEPRGILITGDHVAATQPEVSPRRPFRVPKLLSSALPISPVNALSLRAFNTLYFHRPLAQGLVHYQPFFYPLDGILEWNRLYGRPGFYQYQCALPFAGGLDALRAILRAIADAHQGSFLAVLKTFGDVPSPGLLSYPMPGFNLALDFPNRQQLTHTLFARLDAIIASVGGRLYPAKDARMPAALFRQGYPQLAQFAQHIDPAFSSSFWRRVMETS